MSRCWLAVRVPLMATAVWGVLGGVPAVAQSRLTVDAAPAQRKAINKRIYGVNIANWCAPYYLKQCTPALTNAGVTVVRYGATNIERYNWRNNRMYNVISKTNQYVPTSWRYFIEWARNDVRAEPFLQASVFGHVANDEGAASYDYVQTVADLTNWVAQAGTNVLIWGVGNEPFIAWKLLEYKYTRTNGESYAYNDGAHGDQIYNEDVEQDYYFSRFTTVAEAIRRANRTATILGPTPANWWLYWGTDFSAFCPAKKSAPGAYLDDNGWYAMASAANQADPRVFPQRVGVPEVCGWEMNEQTGAFNDNRNMCQFAKRMNEYAMTHGGTQICNYLDFHRYMNCADDATAVQETRDLWDPDYQSWDKETGGSGTKTKILARFNNLLNYYNTNMLPSLSEYDFFYWQGHPAEMQISALGQVDYLGIFPRQNVQMACNWYIGEPDQSGGGYEHAADSAKQAMFKEDSTPNPKYWAFKLMSDHFRDQSLAAGAAERDAFSVYAGLETSSSTLTVVAHYKGRYYPWNDPYHPGAFIEGQGNSNALIAVTNFTIRGVKKVLRYGRWDPAIVHMAPGGVSVANNSFTYEFEPLSIYLFQFYGQTNPPAESAPAAYCLVHPGRVDFGPYGAGTEIQRHHDEHTGETWYTTNYTHTIKVTNNRNSNTTWRVSESAAWLAIVGPTSGVTEVTAVVPLVVTNRALPFGVYSTQVQVVTSEGTMSVPVTMEVIPGRAQGETRIFDADTHSLAHAWNEAEPYSVGFYDIHGNPEDCDGPFVYDFALDGNEKSSFGGLASMRVDFNRANGDNSAGKLYAAFGTYGHGVSNAPTYCWVPTNANPANYALKFDIKTKTAGSGFTSTRLLMVITDDLGHKGKPNVGIANYKDSMLIPDGVWQTITIPLGTNFFNWAYPGAQDGSLVTMNFAKVRQVEFCPWVGSEDKRGTIWLDNLRVETVNAATNRYPVAVAKQNKQMIATNETVALSATNSFDPDGTIAAYRWVPATGLSASNAASVTFTPPAPGQYRFELFVQDNKGTWSRNPAQVAIKVIPPLVATNIQCYRDAAMTSLISGTAANCLDVYVKLTCSAGGLTNENDFIFATITTTDTAPADQYNNVGPITIVLEETAPASRIFTGHFRLAAFSDEAFERIGFKEGCTIRTACAGITNSFVVGKQTYGYERYIDHIEGATNDANYFDGVWNSYADNLNSNQSVAVMSVVTNAAHSGSTRSMKGLGTLKLSPTGSVDALFAGIMTKLTPFTNEGGNAYYSLSATTGVKGLSFWLRGNGTRVSVVLKSLAITNYDDYLFTIEHTPSNGWKKYYLLFTDFAQEGWGNCAVLREDALKRVNAIQFKFASKINNQTNEVLIDDLALFGGSPTYFSNTVYHKSGVWSFEGYGGLLANPTFEGPNAPGWTMGLLATNENWGGWMMVVEHWKFPGMLNENSFYQTVTNVSASTAYQFSIDCQKGATTYTGTVYLDIVWMNATGGILEAVTATNPAASLSSAMFTTLSTGWRTSPVSTARALVRVRSWNSPTPPYADNCVKFDNASFTSAQPLDNGWITTWTNGFTLTYTTNCAEGQKAAQIGSSLATPGWLAGFLVAPYGQDVTQTNFASRQGFAIKVRRAPNHTATGNRTARFRLSLCQGTNDAPAAKTRWLPVNGSVWEDYTLLPKNRFYTTATVDNTDPAAWTVWGGNWADIGRIVIEYGASWEGFDPYDIIVDDFRPINGGTFMR